MRTNALQEYTQALRLREQGKTYDEIEAVIGAAAKTIHKWLNGAPPSLDRVPNEPLRKAFQASSMRESDVCWRIGWVRARRDRVHNGGLADVTRFGRALGIRPTSNPKGPSYQTTMSAEAAQKIARVIGADFDELYPNLPPLPRKSAGRCSCCRLALARKASDSLCGFCRPIMRRREAHGVSSPTP